MDLSLPTNIESTIKQIILRIEQNGSGKKTYMKKYLKYKRKTYLLRELAVNT